MRSRRSSKAFWPPAFDRTMTIYLMRHGQTVWNVQRRLQGRRDSPLTAIGVAQAEAFGRRLATLEDAKNCRLVASSLVRSWQTAVIAAAKMGREATEIELDDRLVEHAFGEWEGLLWEEVKRDHAASLAARMADRWNTPAPGGESYGDVARRVEAWLRDIEGPAPVAAFCHGVTSRVVRGLYGGLSQEETMALAEPQDRIFLLQDGKVEEIEV